MDGHQHLNHPETTDPRKRVRRRILDRNHQSIRDRMGDVSANRLLEELEKLHYALVDCAAYVAYERPEQYDRLADTVGQLAESFGVTAFAGLRPVQCTITEMRRAALKLGLGRIVNPRTGETEHPELGEEL